MLQATDLTKRYEDGLLALDHLNLEVNEGEIFCLLGANGAGKTTAINLFLNFIDPTDGTALIDGIDVTKEPLKSKDYVSFVSENVMLYGNFNNMRTKSYSKGMRQKLGIAIAIIKDAPNIILDEPTAGLDPKAAAELLDMLLELKNQGKSIFVSTHDIFRAKAIADRVGILKKGRMIMIRSREELEDEDLGKLYLEYMQ